VNPIGTINPPPPSYDECLEKRQWLTFESPAEVRAFGRCILDLYGLPEWKISVTKRVPKTRMGDCNYLKKLIRINTNCVRRFRMDVIIDTILHEAAHATDPYSLALEFIGRGSHTPVEAAAVVNLPAQYVVARLEGNCDGIDRSHDMAFARRAAALGCQPICCTGTKACNKRIRRAQNEARVARSKAQWPRFVEMGRGK